MKTDRLKLKVQKQSQDVNTKHDKAGVPVLLLARVDKFREKQKLAKPTQEDIESLNSPISTEESEFLIKNLPTRKIPGQDGLTNEL